MALNLSSRTARARLVPRHKAYYFRIAKGTSLGYRRSSAKTPGAWWVRQRASGRYVENAMNATADDIAEADGVQVLDYRQALQLAGQWVDGAAGPGKDLTVADVVGHYLDWLQVHRKSFPQVNSTCRSRILPQLGPVQVQDLTVLRIEKWHQALAVAPALFRGTLRPAESKDEKRARKVTANRALSILKAALNRGVRIGTIPLPGAWTKVEPFKNVERTRKRFLTEAECERLFNSCDPDFRLLVKAAIYTGMRYGELGALRARDVRGNTLFVEEAKGGTPRDVFLGDEAADFFQEQIAGKRADELLFVKADGLAWGKGHQRRRLAAALELAKIEPLVFHELRHSYASLYLMDGGSVVGLAEQLGHSTVRMVELHYGHLTKSWRAEEARKFGPRFGLKKSNVTNTDRKRKA